MAAWLETVRKGREEEITPGKNFEQNKTTVGSEGVQGTARKGSRVKVWRQRVRKKVQLKATKEKGRGEAQLKGEEKKKRNSGWGKANT